MRRRGFVSPNRAAMILGVHRNTVYNWAQRALAGDKERLTHVQRNAITGYLYIAIEDVNRLKDPEPK